MEDTKYVDAAEIVRCYEELRGWLKNYQPDYDDPDKDCLGIVLNRLWKLNAAMNPRGLPHGHPMRDDALRAVGVSEQAAIHRIRARPTALSRYSEWKWLFPSMMMRKQPLM